MIYIFHTKRLILAFLILAFAVSVHAEPDRYIKPDPLRPDSYQIFNNKGEQTGALNKMFCPRTGSGSLTETELMQGT